jgi:Glycoside hydrolase family 44
VSSASTVGASPRVVRIAGAAFALVAALGALMVADCNKVAPTAGTTLAPSDASAVTITIRCNMPTHAINPLIYGIGVLPMHDAPDSHEWLLGATARRWGGNHTTRYNWEKGNTWNAGKDWYFTNVDYDHATKPADQRFVDNDVEHGLSTALTLPMIGWAAKDGTSYGFPVSAYGAQQSTAPENADKGNGVDSNGVPIAPGSPERTSVVLSPASIGRWVQTIRARDAARGRRGVQMYILDNEPTLWSTTHRDVHPQPVSYDELLERTIAYATEVRRADPDAVIAGPALWGWPAYFHSGVDQAAQPAHPDQDDHDGLPLLPWWLREIATQERRSGVRLIDVVDVHFYPQGRGIGVGLAGETDSDTAARRIRATRSLWDPTYADESWIADKMQVIPRIRHWIDDNHPGLGISIGEWNFGAERDMSGGLATAEALGRFGEQGITSAFYWDYPDRDSPAFWAFRAFRNFDGHGGRFLDESITASSDDPRVSIFASRDAKTQHLVFVVLDLDPSKPVSAKIDASSCGQIVDERRFAYAGGPAGFTSAVDPTRDPSARLSLPAYSMTVLDAHVATAP